MNFEAKYIIAIEGAYKQKGEIISILQNNQQAYEYFLENEYLRAGSYELLTFNYVGVIVFEDVIVCVLPKYYKGLDFSIGRLITDFVLILKVLKKVGHSESIPDSKLLSSNDYLNLSEIVIADKFLRDYIDNGIFSKDRYEVLVNSEGEVNWGMTVNEMDPIYSRRQAIYNNVYTSSVIAEDLNLITELHKWIINYSLNKFGKILGYDFLFKGNCVKNLSELGSIEYLRNCILKELSITFKDREITLLKRINTFLNGINGYPLSSFSLFGTGYFHIIWEKVCSAVFSNKIGVFSRHMPFPIWNDFKGNGIAKETLIPDIIATIDDAGGKLFIFDAKYYNILYETTPKFQVVGNPGISDVSKQYLYKIAFESLPHLSKFNCFIFPKIGDKFFEIFGFIKFELFKGSTIYNLYLSPELVFQGYLNNNLIGKTSLTDIANSIEDMEKKDY